MVSAETDFHASTHTKDVPEPRMCGKHYKTSQPLDPSDQRCRCRTYDAHSTGLEVYANSDQKGTFMSVSTHMREKQRGYVRGISGNTYRVRRHCTSPCRGRRLQ